MRFLLITVTLLTLSACTAMMVGGAADGGQQRAKGERTAGVVASDAAITSRIKSQYVADATVGTFQIGIRTWKGIVTLSGTVGTYRARDKAESIAKSTGGVTAVNNLIVIEDRSVAQ